MDVKCTPKGPVAKLHSRHMAAFDKINGVIDEADQVTAFSAKAVAARTAVAELKACLLGESKAE